MPRIVYDEAVFHSLYDGATIQGPAGEVKLGYHRSHYLKTGFHHAQGLIGALGLTASDAVAVIGCGFGGTVEGLLALVPGISAVGVDVSPWVQSAKDTTETAYLRGKIAEAGLDPDTGKGAAKLAEYDTGETRAATFILNTDITGGGKARNDIKSALGLKNNEDITWAVSDDLLTSLTDGEITDHIGAMNALAVSCAHLVTPLMPETTQDPRLNWKTMSEWRALIDAAGHPEHVLIRTGRYTVF